jgi:hypothetical protein
VLIGAIVSSRNGSIPSAARASPDLRRIKEDLAALASVYDVFTSERASSRPAGSMPPWPISALGLIYTGRCRRPRAKPWTTGNQVPQLLFRATA